MSFRSPILTRQKTRNILTPTCHFTHFPLRKQCAKAPRLAANTRPKPLPSYPSSSGGSLKRGETSRPFLACSER
jgi:hypothetical protein